jgi:hypothetical protein
MRIRLHDTPARVEAFAADLRRAFDVIEESEDYPDRGRSAKVRRYLDITLRTGAGRAAIAVLADVGAERRRQLDKWGVQHRPDGTGGNLTARAATAKSACRFAEKHTAGGASWHLVLAEEVAEAFAETDPAQLRAELVQVAAVAAAWIEDIDHRTT